MPDPIRAAGITLHPSHPGLLLAEEMEHRGLNANSLSLRLKVPRNRLTAIMKGARGISADSDPAGRIPWHPRTAMDGAANQLRPGGRGTRIAGAYQGEVVRSG